MPYKSTRRTLGPSPLDMAVHNRDQNILQIVEDAVHHREVRLAFQPVVQAQEQGQAAFYEGLIRVTDPTGRIIPAGQFIDAIEERETGRLLDCLALEHGLRTLTQTPGIRLAINLSARSIGYPKWRKVLERGLSRDPSVAQRLILEITEASAMLVPELVVQAMRDLQKLGISFAHGVIAGASHPNDRSDLEDGCSPIRWKYGLTAESRAQASDGEQPWKSISVSTCR